MASNNPSPNQSNYVSHEDIARRARELWDNRGQPAGQDQEIWLEAERDLTRSAGGAAYPQSSTSNQTSASSRRAASASSPSSSRPASRGQRGEDDSSTRGAEGSARDNAMREPDRDI